MMSDAVTPVSAGDALMYQREHRAARLDGYAELYQAAIAIWSLMNQYEEVAREPLEGDQADRTEVVVKSYAEAIREYVAEEYPDAVRATLE